MKLNKKFSLIILILLIFLACGCINNQNNENDNSNNKSEKVYLGVRAKIDYGNRNISSNQINEILNQYNISTNSDGNYIVLFFQKYSKYYEFERLKTNYRGHENDTYQRNLEFGISYWNRTNINEFDPLLNISYENDLKIIEMIVTDIKKIMETELQFIPINIEYEKIIECPYDP